MTPRSEADIALLAAYARTLDADIVALQEVDGRAVAARLFPPDRYDIYLTHDAVTQRVGFAIRKGLAWIANPDVAALDLDPGARWHLRSGADITVTIDGHALRLLAVHLKAGCREDDFDHTRRPQCATLHGQLAPLAGWVAQRQADGAPFIVLGDLNRWMDPPDAFAAVLDRAAPLLRATAGRSNPCWGDAPFVDQIIAGGAARAWIEPGSLRVLLYRETDRAFRERLSDHCPVSVRLRLP